MSDYEKHRLGAEDFEVEFADQLGASDNLTGTPSVSIAQWVAGTGWVDKTSEFSVSNKGLSGTMAVFRLGAATGTDQARGLYVVTVSVDTNLGETLHEEPSLFIRDEGDPNAP